MKKIIPLIIALTPGFVLAATDIPGVFDLIWGSVLLPLTDFLIAIAVVVFIWGVLKYMQAAGEEDVSEAKRFIVYGLIGIFIMSSVWGLVKVIESTLDIRQSGIPTEVGKLE
jgi:hypothetical protein